MQDNSLSLFELNSKIKDLVYGNLSGTFWVRAEISDIKENYNGHCYLELIEKSTADENIIARTRATIWSFTYRILKPYFESSAGRKLEHGMKILINASVDFHELYGFSLNIKDIEPAYTLGDLELQKQLVIKRLTDEGVIEMNHQLEFPMVPQRIAVISSDTAAGFEDFVDQLENNPYGYKFYYKLFQASMQGASSEESIINALDRINKYLDNFDVVVIIRGGGSRSDLSCFDSYWLSFNVAQFPLPVITGIGHEKDNSVVDLVAHTRMKTPTAVAEFLSGKVSEFEAGLDETLEYLRDHLNEIVNSGLSQIENLSLRIFPAISNKINMEKFHISDLRSGIERSGRSIIKDKRHELMTGLGILKNSVRMVNLRKMNNLDKLGVKFLSDTKVVLNSGKHKLELMERSLELADPQKILEKGFSITYLDGKVLKKDKKVNIGDKLKTQLADIKIESNVTKVENI